VLLARANKPTGQFRARNADIGGDDGDAAGQSIQRTALAMLVVAGVINYIDRATLSVANLLIRDDLHLSIADMGYLLSAFLWAYAFAQLPTGAMVDKLGPPVGNCGASPTPKRSRALKN
jgi:sugar phosphate permease